MGRVPEQSQNTVQHTAPAGYGNTLHKCIIDYFLLKCKTGMLHLMDHRFVFPANPMKPIFPISIRSLMAGHWWRLETCRVLWYQRVWISSHWDHSSENTLQTYIESWQIFSFTCLPITQSPLHWHASRTDSPRISSSTISWRSCPQWTSCSVWSVASISSSWCLRRLLCKGNGWLIYFNFKTCRTRFAMLFWRIPQPSFTAPHAKAPLGVRLAEVAIHWPGGWVFKDWPSDSGSGEDLLSNHRSEKQKNMQPTYPTDGLGEGVNDVLTHLIHHAAEF